MNKYYSDLGKALRAMDVSPNTHAMASLRRRGPHAVSIQEAVPLDDGGEKVLNANAQFYPDKTVWSEFSVSEEEINNLYSSMAQAGEELMPITDGAVESVTSVVETVSPAAANTLKEKFDSLSAGQKVAAGVGVYVGGKAALSFIPMKYLLLAGAAYLYTQMQKKQAAIDAAATQAAAASSSQPVSGMV